MRNLFKWLVARASPAPRLPSLVDIRDLKGKYVLLRASLNVPIKDGVVVEDFRIKQTLPTINYLQKQGARVIVIGHIGREPDETLLPVFEVLKEKVGAKWDTKPEDLQDGEVLLLENIRSDDREITNDDAYAKELAELADIYINDAFSDSHRPHASIIGVPKYLPSYFGLNFIKEYEALQSVIEPEHPALFILGGAKFETKIPLVEKFTNTYDNVFIGGALANDIFKARGFETGRSMVSSINLIGSSILKKPNLSVPVDVVIVNEEGSDTLKPAFVRKGDKILDIGYESLAELAPLIQNAKTILWNGPLGNYEVGFSAGTEALAKMISASDAYSVVGGGDTIASIQHLHLSHHFGFLSTAGGAMLTFLETGTLPAIDAVLN